MSNTILVVEDEAEIADTLRYVIETEGMQCIWLPQGRTVMKCIAQHGVDLVILDVGLPDCNGFDLLKIICHDIEIPVMMLTARGDEVDRVVGLELGADDYVTKPFSPREVVARIKAILKRSQKRSRALNHEFQLNEAAVEVTYRDTRLELTHAEYTLMNVLIKSPGQVFSRQQLIEHIWSDQHPSSTRVIDTHVKAIRAKLHQIDPDSKAIVTHRNFGYSLSFD